MFECVFLNAVFFLNFFFRKLLSVRQSCDVFELVQNAVAQLKILRAFFKGNKVKSLDIHGLLTKKSKQTDNDNNESKEVGALLFTCSEK